VLVSVPSAWIIIPVSFDSLRPIKRRYRIVVGRQFSVGAAYGPKTHPNQGNGVDGFFALFFLPQSVSRLTGVNHSAGRPRQR